MAALARGLLKHPEQADGLEDSDLHGDLLPDWYDDWVLVERERLRQLRLHALERLAERAIGEARYGQAIDIALTAIQADPLRESAHRMLIRAHAAEGNSSLAIGSTASTAGWSASSSSSGRRPSCASSSPTSAPKLARRPGRSATGLAWAETPR